MISFVRLLTLLLFQATCSATPCSRGFIILRIRHQDCMPKSVMTSACRGTCTSYVRPSVESPDNLERFCQCCDADDIRNHRVLVRCPNHSWYPGAIGVTRFRRIRLAISLPASCRCRPCSPVPLEIVPAENDIMREGKRAFYGQNLTKTGEMERLLSSEVTITTNTTIIIGSKNRHMQP